MKRAWMKKVKAIPTCGTDNHDRMEKRMKQAQPKLKRRVHTSAAIIGLAISMGGPNLLLTRQSDRTPAAEPPISNESTVSTLKATKELVSSESLENICLENCLDARTDTETKDIVVGAESTVSTLNATTAPSSNTELAAVTPADASANTNALPTTVIETSASQSPIDLVPPDAQLLAQAIAPTAASVSGNTTQPIPNPIPVSPADKGETTASNFIVDTIPSSYQKIPQPVSKPVEITSTDISPNQPQIKAQPTKAYRTNRLVQKLKTKAVPRQDQVNRTYGSPVTSPQRVRQSALISGTASTALSREQRGIVNRLKQRSNRGQSNVAKLRLSTPVTQPVTSAVKSLLPSPTQIESQSIKRAVAPSLVVDTIQPIAPQISRTKIKDAQPASKIVTPKRAVAPSLVVDTKTQPTAPQISSTDGDTQSASIVVDTKTQPTAPQISSTDGDTQSASIVAPPIAVDTKNQPVTPQISSTDGDTQPASVVAPSIVVDTKNQPVTPQISSTDGDTQPASVVAPPERAVVPSIVVDTIPDTTLLTRWSRSIQPLASQQVDAASKDGESANQAAPQTVYVIADSSKSDVNQPNVRVASLGSEYKVKSGDTLTAIARRHQIKLAEIVRANKIANPDRLLVDQELVIPVANGSPNRQIVTSAVSSANLPMAIATDNSDTVAQAVSYTPSTAIAPPANYSGIGGSVVDNTEAITSPPSFYAQGLQTDVQKLRQKYNSRPDVQTVVSSATSKTTPVWSSQRQEPVNPEFAIAQALPSTQRVRQQRYPVKANVGTKSKARLATASRDTDAAESLQSFRGQQVSPELPPLGAVDTYLPKPTVNPFNGYIWPAKGVLTSGYGWRWGRMHKGIDVAAPIGTPIVAAAPGVVIRAGWNSGGYGKLVDIKHADGSFTRYAHNNRILVQAGQEVQQGQQISEMGSTGFSTGPHLHFEVHPTGKGAVNPIAFLPNR